MKIYNVLVFPGGTEIGLEIHKSLCFEKNIRLFSAGQSISNHAPFVFLDHFTVPNISEAGWIERLNEIIEANKIDFVYPAHDDIIVALALNRENIKANIVSSPLTSCLITRSKSKTYSELQDIVPVPRTFEFEEVDYFPVFVKPDKGQGSQDIHIAKNSQHLEEILAQGEDYIILEYLTGEEYTIDCFSDRDKGLMFCDIRQRVRTRNGISVNSISVQDNIELLKSYAQKISDRLKLNGAWFFQVKRDTEGELKLLEVAPRIAGTMALQRARGVNMALLSLYENIRVPIEILQNPYPIEIDRALINRYRNNFDFDKVYVDLDDTLILDQKVNTVLVSFIFQCVNSKILVILLTKHSGDLKKTLEKFRLSGLFDEIIQVSKSRHKWSYISGAKSILIDDSFSERFAAHAQKKIMTFDCSMVEALLDDRR